jgi:2-iminobutanoate/2-iminopropanoate deaminase
MKRILALLSVFVFTSGTYCVANPTYSEAVTAGDYVYVSAQYPIDPSTGQIVVGNIDTLTNVVLDNLQHQLHVKGYTMNQVIKTEVYLTDIRYYDSMDAAYGARFPFQYPPARDVIQVAGLLQNSPISISCIAYKHRN